MERKKEGEDPDAEPDCFSVPSLEKKSRTGGDRAGRKGASERRG